MITTPARFRVAKKITLPRINRGRGDGTRGAARELNNAHKASMQLFPWAVGAAETLFSGSWRAADRFRKMLEEFEHALAVVAANCLHVLHTDGLFSYCFPLDDKVSENGDMPQVAWALRSSAPSDPLVLVADHRRVFVFSTRQKQVIGYIRGHGGRITSIAVHPRSPNIFATTSADFTTRIYNLDYPTVSQTPENPAWPPWNGPSLGSAAHGADGFDSTGDGCGHCFQLLVGGRSGGHAWDVLDASFHPHLPLIATCGADRHVKIWRILSDKSETLCRDDKPLFSARITTSRVLSIAWVGEDLLLIHTATTYTPIRHKGSSEYDLQLPEIIDPGTIDIFQWLGLKRFFPTSDSTLDPTVRGGVSDYQDSTSYTIISTEPLTFPENVPVDPISNISQPQMRPGYVLLVYPKSTDVLLAHVSKFRPRTLPPNNGADSLVDVTKRIRLDESRSPSPDASARGGTPAAEHLFQFDDLEPGVQIAACALTRSGKVVILGSEGGVWFLTEEAQP